MYSLLFAKRARLDGVVEGDGVPLLTCAFVDDCSSCFKARSGMSNTRPIYTFTSSRVMVAARGGRRGDGGYEAAAASLVDARFHQSPWRKAGAGVPAA